MGRALHLDHLGAEVGEQSAQFAAGNDYPQIDYAQPLERQLVRRSGIGMSAGGYPARSVLPGPRRRCAETRAFPVHAEIADGNARAHTAGQFGVGHRPDREKVVGVGHLGRFENGGDGNAVRLPCHHEFVHGAVGELAPQPRADLVPGRKPLGDGVVPGVLVLLRFAHPRAKAVPLPRGHHDEPNVTVLARDDRVRILVAWPASPLLRTLRSGGLAVRAERRVERRKDRLVPRKIDVITTAAM